MKPYYQDKHCTIYHGDCREVLPTLEPVDLVFTSPPYLSARDYTSPIKNWNLVVPCGLSAVPAKEETQILVNLGLIHDKGRVVRYWDNLIACLEGEGYDFAGWYVWDKLYSSPGEWVGRLAPAHEFIFHFRKVAVELVKTEKCKRAGEMRSGTGLRGPAGGMRGLSKPGPTSDTKIHDSVFRLFPEKSRNHGLDHPAIFPQSLPAKIISVFPGDVLDPFMGSGTTLRAAKDLGRKAIGIEIEEKYCEIAAKRLRQEVFDFSAAQDR